MDASVVRVGPAGWAYDDWKGYIYPKRMPKSLHPLTYLADFFDTIEINVSFYRPVPPEYAVSWISKIADNPRFKFTAKVWKRFTHDRDNTPVMTEVEMARRGLDVLAEANRLGALLIQFPWSFRNTPENQTWLDRVIEWFAAYPLVVEVRHVSWNTPAVYDRLKQQRVAFCNIDQPIFHDSVQPTQQVTASIGYVRLHGRNYDDWFRESAGRDDRYDYLYSEEELKPWIDRIERIRQQTEEMYVITNNHYRGQAVANAFDILAGLGKSDFLLPQHMLEAYPRLRRCLSSDAPETARQQTLF